MISTVLHLAEPSSHALKVVVVVVGVVVVAVVVGLGVLRGIEEVTVFPVPAYLTAGDNCAKPTAGGSYLYTLYTFFCRARK